MNKKIIHTVFEVVSEKYPTKIAVRNGDSTITYCELNNISNQLAHLMKSISVHRNTTVAVFTEPGIALIQSILAIFKCGAVYLPIGLSDAEERVKQSFTDCRPEVIVTNSENASQVKLLTLELSLQVKWLVVCSRFKFELYKLENGKWIENNTNKNDYSITNPELVSEPDDSNYIFYTSGSTGVAKAILGCHKGLGHFINWEIKEFGISENCVVSLLSQFTFDASLRDIFLPLCAGGTLCIPSFNIKTHTTLLLKWIEENKITLIHCVPSVFRLITKEMESFPGRQKIHEQLAFILMAGEPLYVKDITNWRLVMGNSTEIVNLYGTTETTLAKTFHRIKDIPADPGQILHSGKPITNTIIAILNDGLLCSPGEIGQIFIKTPFMSKGYYKNKKLTDEVFVQNPLVKDHVDIMHSTGDFGRYTTEMNIEVLGRKDDQVKINGIRVELGEIRKKVAAIEKIDEVEVMAHKNSNSETELVCYYTGEKYDIDELKEKLKKTLNRAVTPAFFVHLEKFPLTINGKIDRKSLPRPSVLIINEGDYEAPIGELETQLEEIWISILGLKKISRHAPFFQIGGSSLKGILLISAIHKRYNVLIRIKDVFVNQTIQKMADLIQIISEKEEFKNIETVPLAENYNLSLEQKGVYLTCQSNKDLFSYNIPLSYRITGRLNKVALQKTFETLVERHESLRTTFKMIKGQPVQIINAACDLNFLFSYSDLRDDEHKQETASNMADDQARMVFDLASGPLIRASLLQIYDREHVFLFTMHHIISDGWSMEILIQEIITLYNAYNLNESNPLEPLKIQYKDYVGWQQKQLSCDTMNKSRNYWLSTFEEAIPPLQFPSDFPRSDKPDFRGAAKDFTMNQSLVNDIKKICLETETTIFMLLLSALNVLVYHYTGKKDILFGSPIAGRSHSDLENQVGLFVNMVLFRTQFQSDDLFRDLLKKVKKNSLDAYQHSNYPFSQLVEDIDAVYGHNMNNCIHLNAQLQNAKFNKTKTLQFDQLKVDNFLPNSYSSKFEITFNFEELEDEGVIVLSIEYKTGLFKETTINKLSDEFFSLLEMIIKSPAITISQIRRELVSKNGNLSNDRIGTEIEKGIGTEY